MYGYDYNLRHNYDHTQNLGDGSNRHYNYFESGSNYYSLNGRVVTFELSRYLYTLTDFYNKDAADFKNGFEPYRRPRLIIDHAVNKFFNTENKPLEDYDEFGNLIQASDIYNPLVTFDWNFSDEDENLNKIERDKFQKTFLQHYYFFQPNAETQDFFINKLESFMQGYIPAWSRMYGLAMTKQQDLLMNSQDSLASGTSIGLVGNQTDGKDLSDSKSRAASQTTPQERGTYSMNPDNDTWNYADNISGNNAKSENDSQRLNIQGNQNANDNASHVVSKNGNPAAFLRELTNLSTNFYNMLYEEVRNHRIFMSV